MIQPPIHPMAEELRDFMLQGFGTEAAKIVAAFQQVLGNTDFMRGLEAYCFVHETTIHGDTTLMQIREGMRRVALIVAAARSIDLNQLNQEALEDYGPRDTGAANTR